MRWNSGNSGFFWPWRSISISAGPPRPCTFPNRPSVARLPSWSANWAWSFFSGTGARCSCLRPEPPWCCPATTTGTYKGIVWGVTFTAIISIVIVPGTWTCLAVAALCVSIIKAFDLGVSRAAGGIMMAACSASTGLRPSYTRPRAWVCSWPCPRTWWP